MGKGGMQNCGGWWAGGATQRPIFGVQKLSSSQLSPGVNVHNSQSSVTFHSPPAVNVHSRRQYINSDLACSSSYRMTPRLQMSTAGPLYSLPCTISGAVNSGVPHSWRRFPEKGVVMPAKPKSAILTLVDSSMRMFSGFRSLWITRLPHAHAHAANDQGRRSLFL